MSKRSYAVAHLRQLCCLGTDSHVIMPSLLGALHAIIPSVSNSFYWTDEDEDIADAFQEHVIPEAMDVFFAKLPNLFADPAVVSISAAAAAKKVTGNLRHPPPATYRSDLYQSVLRPHQCHYALDALVLDRNTVLGAVVLWRSEFDRDFSSSDEAILCSLVPYIRHALSPPASKQLALATSTSKRHGLVVCDRYGRAEFLSKTARELLYWAARDAQVVGPSGCEAMSVPPAIVALCHRLDAAFQGQECGVPALHHRNQWGDFIFRAYWLESEADPVNGRIGIVVERREPLVVRIADNLRERALSPMQSEVGHRVAQGMSNESIAKDLSISVTTVRDHLDRIYQKLNVYTRADLVKTLTE